MIGRSVPVRPPLKNQAPPVAMHAVKSSFIAAIGHDAAAGRIHVEMLDGEGYDYPGTAEELQAWRTSIDGGHSAGRFFHQNIRGRDFKRRPKKAA
jgi:hypothetical protein